MADTLRISMNANYPCSSLRALVGCHFWRHAETPPPPTHHHFFHQQPLISIMSHVFDSSACKCSSFGGVCHPMWAGVARAALCPTFVGKTNIYCGEKDAVLGYRRVGRVRGKDDNFISVWQVGSHKRMDGSKMKWKWIVSITGSDRTGERWETNGIF